MTDMDCVIDGLRKAAEELARYAPMKVNGRCQMYFDGAIYLLKKQEAIEPKKENDGNPELCTSWWYVCGDCGRYIDPHDRFCRHCGREVDWCGSDA